MALFGEKKSFFGKLSERIGDAILARPTIDEELMDDLEEILITSDIGMDTTMKIMVNLREYIKNEYITNPERIKDSLVKIIAEIMDKGERQKLCQDTPLVILVIGINGGGKT
ncbi:MAG: signal recognition particle receptor subunit alpha, partial [Anaerovoracaceae bacterium]